MSKKKPVQVTAEGVVAQTKEITVTIAHKLNLGNYANRDFFLSAKVEVLPGQDFREVMDYSCRDLREKLNLYLTKTVEDRKNGEIPSMDNMNTEVKDY